MSVGHGLKLAAIGIDHGHIFGMLGNMLKEGCTAAQWWTADDWALPEKFQETYPDLERVADRRTILDDPDVDMVLIAAVPEDRAALAIEAMRAGKDVMVDKPGCTTLEHLAQIKAVVAETGRIWTVNFSERFQVPCVAKAEELVRAGGIGTVIQTIGMGPHKQNLSTRPAWFFERNRYGGILTDIASHQVDQFLHFTGSTDVQIKHAQVANKTLPEHPGMQDFGELVLQGDKGHGYIRVDWFTPKGLPMWGDGRLTIMGSDGYIELRKYIDLANGNKGDQLLIANGEGAQVIDCREMGLPYFARICADIHNRSQTAVTQDHTFRTMDITIRAQMQAEGVQV
ncbi:Gfo/Idh/MocA family protein [Celeribacter marinus]|uniref:Oxidoreductase n=1 Tax=Celeribacter marinus TaxID=1397108 RepID=A0A0N9ZKH4_9RHOB|nr:Gfo/Idh/MocA family oxidoreductase [Celeribacter marinus]ALI56195.1 oxidoreductase [Celeribacter marinus]SFK85441.1 Predicted dehydrogenase [Celeribacter marinus]